MVESWSPVCSFLLTLSLLMSFSFLLILFIVLFMINSLYFIIPFQQNYIYEKLSLNGYFLKDKFALMVHIHRYIPFSYVNLPTIVLQLNGMIVNGWISLLHGHSDQVGAFTKTMAFKFLHSNDLYTLFQLVEGYVVHMGQFMLVLKLKHRNLIGNWYCLLVEDNLPLQLFPQQIYLLNHCVGIHNNLLGEREFRGKDIGNVDDFSPIMALTSILINHYGYVLMLPLNLILILHKIFFPWVLIHYLVLIYQNPISLHVGTTSFIIILNV